MNEYHILEKKESKNYKYYKLEKNNQLFFAKQVRNDNSDNKENLKNEISKYQCIRDLDFIPKIVEITKNTIIYEYIEGKTLDKYKNFTVNESINILIQLADILEKLHQKRIVHCDIKPNNIMITKTGKIMLLDFGNSRFINEKTHFGTIKYCSIPQLQQKNVNTTFDIYPLGIMMYELLTGKKAYGNMNKKEIKEEKQKQNLKITSIVINMPKLTDIILEKMLGNNINDMYIDMKEVKKDLLLLKNKLSKV